MAVMGPIDAGAALGTAAQKVTFDATWGTALSTVEITSDPFGIVHGLPNLTSRYSADGLVCFLI